MRIIITIRGALTLLLLFFLFSFSNAQVLQYGDAITASISAVGEVDTYSFDGKAGDIIRIRMRGTSQGVNACFKLYAPSGTLLTEDCDDGGIVEVTAFELPANGTYKIEAEDHNGNDTGDYGIALEVLNKTAGVEMVDCGSDIVTNLEHWTEVDLFGLRCKKGDQLLIQMRGLLSNIECRIELIDPDGNILAKEITTSGLAIIESYEIPSNGLYLIAAYDGNGNDIGAYGISFQILNKRNCSENIQMGSTINSKFDQLAQMDAYRVKCAAGDELVVRLKDRDGGIEPSLLRCDAEGMEIETVIDPNQSEISYTIPVNGNYYIIVRDDKGNDIGAYDLSLMGESTFDPSLLSCDHNSFSATLEQEIDVHQYTFEAQAGEIISVQMRGYDNGVDASLKIYSPEGNVIAADFSFGSIAVIQDLILPYDGLYLITAEDENNNDKGEYGFSFQKTNHDVCGEFIACNAATFETKLENFAQMDVYEFEGEEGQLVTMVMEQIDDALEPSVRLYGPDGSLLVEDSKSLHVDITDFELPKTGNYKLVCSDEFGNDIGAYKLSIDKSTACTICPEDTYFYTSDFEEETVSDAPFVESMTGGGTYDMVIKFAGNIETNGACTINSAAFDSGCNGVRTGCYGNILRLTPQYSSCFGPLPVPPFTITFNDDFSVYFDENGVPQNQGGASSTIVERPEIQEWLGVDLDITDCDVRELTTNFDPLLFENISDSIRAGEVVIQEVSFQWLDYCDNFQSCTATITVINDMDTNPTAIAEPEINIFPNPAIYSFNADLSEFLGQDINIVVTDNHGNVAYEESIHSLAHPIFTLDLSNPIFQNGLYHLTAIGQDGAVISQSFSILKEAE